MDNKTDNFHWMSETLLFTVEQLRNVANWSGCPVVITLVR